MTKQQAKLLKLAYKQPITVRTIYKKLGLNYDSFYALTVSIQKYWHFQKKSVYEDSLFLLSDEGYEYIESTRKADIRYWITTVLGIVAAVASVIAAIASVIACLT